MSVWQCGWEEFGTGCRQRELSPALPWCHPASGPQRWARRGTCIKHHLALLSPGALGGCSSTNAISLLQSDLLHFKGSVGIHTQKNYSFFNSFWKVFSFLLCWSCDCLVYSAILKGLSGSHRGKRFPCDRLCAVQKE